MVDYTKFKPKGWNLGEKGSELSDEEKRKIDGVLLEAGDLYSNVITMAKKGAADNEFPDIVKNATFLLNNHANEFLKEYANTQAGEIIVKINKKLSVTLNDMQSNLAGGGYSDIQQLHADIAKLAHKVAEMLIEELKEEKAAQKVAKVA